MTKRTHTKSSHKKTKGDVGKQSAGYRIYSTEQRAHRAELKTMSTKEQTKVLGAEWRKLSAQQKQAYQAKAPAETMHHGIHKKKAKSRRKTSGANAKQHSQLKKKTKRTAGRKGAAHHGEDHHNQANETVHNSHE